MKKRLVSLLLVLLLLTALLPSALAADVRLSPQNLTVNGVHVRCEKYNIDGYNYFKLRDLAFLLNGTESQFAVGYDEDTNTVVIDTGLAYAANGTELLFDGTDKSDTAQASPQSILLNGKPVRSLSAYNIGGYNYFKLRDLGDAVGFLVDYDETTNTAIVRSGKPAPQELTPEQIYARCAPAVFYVEIYDRDGWCTKTGSGFFLTSDGIAVTNYHVISGAASARITVSDTGATYEVLGIYDSSPEEDWAVLQIGGSGFQTLEIGDPDYDVGGATVYAIGSPLGLQNTISSGIISNPYRMDGGMTYIQMSAAISPGSSGGALLNKYGQVIGITSATYSEGQNLNLAIPMTYLEGMDVSAYGPLNDRSGDPSGILSLSDYKLNLALDQEATVRVNAVEKNCTGVSVKYSIVDESVVQCTWGSWHGDDIDLNLKGLSIGSTEITVYFLISESQLVLDTKTLVVTVGPTAGGPRAEGVEFSVERSALAVSLFGSGSLNVHAFGGALDDESTISYYVDDPSILTCEWSAWNGDEIILYVSPLAAGTTKVTIVYHLDDGTLLAQETVTVSVIFGTVTVSEDELGMAPGESVTLTVTLSSDSPNPLTVEYNIYGDDCVSCAWGSWQDDACTVCTLTVTALKAGEADVEISLLDLQNDLFLNAVSIPVSVS